MNKFDNNNKVMLDNQLIYQSNASPPNRPRTKTQTTSKIDYRGITLK